jgi:N-acetyl-anhydromuramyl-L-alanine amidase AmpD
MKYFLIICLLPAMQALAPKPVSPYCRTVLKGDTPILVFRWRPVADATSYKIFTKAKAGKITIVQTQDTIAMISTLKKEIAVYGYYLVALNKFGESEPAPFRMIWQK